jgi:hypothetical protein
MSDRFFTTIICDRCKESLEGKSRQMSWFTEECLCPDCSNKEKETRKNLTSKGFDDAELEGCGYIPEI